MLLHGKKKSFMSLFCYTYKQEFNGRTNNAHFLKLQVLIMLTRNLKDQKCIIDKL